MIMADVFKWLFLILGTMTTLVGYWLFFEALCPRIVEKARGNYETRAVRSVVVGFFVALPVAVVALALVSAPGGVVKFLGFLLYSLLILVGLLGSSGLARHLGTRLPSPNDSVQPWRRVFRGGTVLTITFILPVIGWLVLLPLTLISGIGAVVLTRAKQAPQETPVTVESGAQMAQA